MSRDVYQIACNSPAKCGTTWVLCSWSWADSLHRWPHVFLNHIKFCHLSRVQNNLQVMKSITAWDFWCVDKKLLGYIQMIQTQKKKTFQTVHFRSQRNFSTVTLLEMKLILYTNNQSVIPCSEVQIQNLQLESEDMSAGTWPPDGSHVQSTTGWFVSDLRPSFPLLLLLSLCTGAKTKQRQKGRGGKKGNFYTESFKLLKLEQVIKLLTYALRLLGPHQAFPTDVKESNSYVSPVCVSAAS